MKIKADLHNHIAHNKLDSFKEPGFLNRVINLTAKRLGPGGILGLVDCLEDDRYTTFIGLEGYKREKIGNNAVYFPEKDISVYHGQEVFARGGHVLVLGLPENYHIGELGKVWSINLENTFKEARDNGWIIGADHPFSRYGGSGPYLEEHLELLKDIGFVEIHNGEAWISLFANRKAQKFYERIKKDYNIGAICSSDGHSISEIGSSCSEIEKPVFKNSEELTTSLDKSIRAHKDHSEDKKSNSYYATLNSATKTFSWYIDRSIKNLNAKNKIN